MKKMVWLQIGLALFAFGITARIFFKERPYAAQNHELQQELTQVKETNEQLEENMSAVKVDRKASRSYIRQGRAFFHQQKFDDAVEQYDKALKEFPDDPYGLRLKIRAV